MPESTIPVSIDDPVNRRILAVSEDQVSGFHREPFAAIAERSGVDESTVIERLRVMLAAGVIRRIRQTLLATNLAPGALVAWKLDPEKLDEAFDWMYANDPFTGHVVIRSTDADTPGAAYRLWTTLKVPQGFSREKHCEFLRTQVGAEKFVIMPAKRVFKLGVGHVRRQSIDIGDRTAEPADSYETRIVELSDLDWRVLVELKREFAEAEIGPNPWQGRAAAAGLSLDAFCEVAESLSERGVIGRFSTFLEHVKKSSSGQPVTRYNALFHWAVPEGMEIAAGSEVGRHVCMTHAYWREAGSEFNHVNIMGVAHGRDKDRLLAHKAAIDQHLEEAGIPVHYTNVFWGGRSEIKPSEIAPDAYLAWCEQQGITPDAMRA